MSEAGLMQCVGMDAADGLDGGLLEVPCVKLGGGCI